MVPNPIQWQFNLFSNKLGRFRIVINRGSYDFIQAAADIMYVERGIDAEEEEIIITKQSDDNGVLVWSDLSQLRIISAYKFRGTIDGVTTDYDLFPDLITQLEHIFNDDTLLYTIWIDRQRDDDSFEHVFCGDCKANDVLFEDTGIILNEGTSDETAVKIALITTSSLKDRLESVYFSDLEFLASDTAGEILIPGYGGLKLTSRNSDDPSWWDNETFHAWKDYSNGASGIVWNKLDSGANNSITDRFNPSANNGEWSTFDYTILAGDFPYGFPRWLSAYTIYKKVFDFVGVEFGSSSYDEITPQHIVRAWSGGDEQFSAVANASDTWSDIAEFYVNYGVITGTNQYEVFPPLGTQVEGNPASWAAKSLLDVVRLLCQQFIYRLEIGIIQTGAGEGNPTVYLRNRFTDTEETVPTTWQVVAESQKDENRRITPKVLKIYFSKDEDAFYFPKKPLRNEDTVDIEMPFRNHSYSDPTTFDTYSKHLIYDAKQTNPPLLVQHNTWYEYVGYFRNTTGFVGGMHLFWWNQNIPGLIYPSIWANYSQNYDNTDWSGMYAHQHIIVGSATYESILEAYGQIYANLLLSDRYRMQVDFNQVANADDSIIDVTCGIRYTSRRRGVTVEWQAKKVQQFLVAKFTRINFEQVQTEPIDKVFPYELDTDTNTTGGSGALGTGGNGGDSGIPDSGYLLTAPPNVDRNTAQPTLDTVHALIAKQHSSTQSVDLYQNRLDDDTVVTGFNEVGNLFFENAFRFTLSCPALSQNTDYVLPNDYPAVAGYVLASSLTGDLSWVVNGSGGSTSPAGANTQVQYNASGSFGASAAFTFASGVVGIGTGSSTTGVVRLFNSTNANTISIQAGVTTGSYTLTLPVDDGTSGQFLQTNGSGVTTWANPTTGAGGNDTEVQYNNTGALAGDSGFTYNSSTNFITLGVGSTASGGVIFRNATNNNTVTMNAGTTSASWVFTLPVNAGTNNYLLKTNGSGVTSWVDVATIFTVGTDTQVIFNDTGVLVGDAGFVFNKTTDALTLGVGSSTTGSVIFKNGTNNNTLTLRSGVTATSYTLTLPTTAGTNNYVLTTNGSGTTTWTNATSLVAPAGVNTNIQYNNSGVFGAEAAFSWNAGANSLLLGEGAVSSATIVFNNASNGNQLTLSGGITSTSYTFTFPLNAGSNNYVLKTNGSGVTSWADATTLIFPAGSDTQVQYNDAGSFGAESAFTYNKTTNTLGLGVAGVSGGNIVFKNSTNASTITITSAGAVSTWTLTLPLDDGTSGQFLQTNGSGVTSWQTVTTTPAGADTNIQYNNAGAFGAESAFSYNASTNKFILGENNVSAVTVDFNNATNTNILTLSGGVTSTSYTFTFPLNAGTNNYVLITNGSGTTSWANVNTLVTGLQYWTEATNTSAPNATIPANSWTPTTATTHADAVVKPKGTDGSFLLAIPDNSTTGGNKRGVKAVDLQLGRTNASEVVTGTSSFAVGHSNTVAGTYAGSIGLNNNSNGDYNILGGYNNTATNNSVAITLLGYSNSATQNYSFAIGNSNEITAIGAGAFGILNEVSGQSSIALCQENVVTGASSIGGGYLQTVNGNQSASFGHTNTVDGEKSFATGQQAYTNIDCSRVFAGAGFDSRLGSSQARDFIVKGTTDDAAPTELLVLGGQLVLADYAAWTVDILVTASQANGTGEGASYQILGRIIRGANAASTTIEGTPVKTVLFESTGTMDATITADTSSGALRVIVTGVAATNLLWTARVTTSEVIGEPDP